MRPRSTIAMHLVLGAGLAAALSACKKESAQPGYRPEAATPAPAAPPAAPAAPAATAPAATAPTAPAPTATTATVLETMNSGGYTYAKLDLGTEQTWVAGPETKLAVGDKVGMTGGTLMTNFTSTTLNRTFDRIYFVGELAVAGAPGAAGAAAKAPATTVLSTEKIDPVAGGQAIGAVISGKATLAGKPVAIRGKVVKYNGHILGKNWLHLQDGSGDLTVTTADTAAPVAVGDIVVARGTLALDKDFGGGYSYAVILEDATLTAQ